MTTYTNDIYGMLLQIADLSGAPDTYSHDRHGQILRLADAVGAAGTYAGDEYSQLKRIADQVGAAGTYSGDIYGQIKKIADAGAAGSFSNDIYGQLSRIVANGGTSGIILSASTFTAGAAQATAIGTLSVIGGTGTPTFTLTDSHTNAAQVAGTNGVNLQVGSASSSAGAFNITVHVTGVTPSISDKTFSLSATAAPANTVAPAISGSAVAGATLTSSTGTFTGFPVPTLTYQWKRAGSPISGATNTTYVVQVADVGSAITVTVTATNGIGSPATSTSSATSSVTKTTLSYTPTTSATNGSAYTGATPSPSGGTASYTYSITAGSLPTGTSLSPSTGIISGTPTVNAAFSGIVLTVTDANGITDSSSSFTITVAASGGTLGQPMGLLLTLTYAA